MVSRPRDRYTTDAEQIGHHSRAVRLADAYALATFAGGWLARTEDTAHAEAQACLDLLCAHIRTPRSPLSADPDAETAADREVRQSIIRIITTHLQETSHTSWSHMDLDFTGAVLAGNFAFAGAKFTGAPSASRGQPSPTIPSPLPGHGSLEAASSSWRSSPEAPSVLDYAAPGTWW